MFYTLIVAKKHMKYGTQEQTELFAEFLIDKKTKKEITIGSEDVYSGFKTAAITHACTPLDFFSVISDFDLSLIPKPMSS